MTHPRDVASLLAVIADLIYPASIRWMASTTARGAGILVVAEFGGVTEVVAPVTEFGTHMFHVAILSTASAGSLIPLKFWFAHG